VRPQFSITTLFTVAISVAVFAVFWSAGPIFALPAGVLVIAMLMRFLPSGWRGPRPVLVDEPGLTFSDLGDGGGPRFVPWESITAVVLFEVPDGDASRNRWQQAIGVSVAGHPDGVSVFRPLSVWSLDREALELAVRRFGQGVPVVTQGRPAAGPSQEQLRAEFRQISSESIRQAREPGAPAEPRVQIFPNRAPRYQPIDPGAYLGRYDLRSHLFPVVLLSGLQVVLWAIVIVQRSAGTVLFAVVFAVPLIWILNGLRNGGSIALAIDRPGVYFGSSHSPGDDQTKRLVPWTEISAVVVFEQLYSDSDNDNHWARAVGVRLRGRPTVVPHWRIIDGWRLDRPALEAAVRLIAPDVPVLDGAPQRPLPISGAWQAARDAAQDRRED
jgi:hypothetical protein